VQAQFHCTTVSAIGNVFALYTGYAYVNGMWVVVTRIASWEIQQRNRLKYHNVAYVRESYSKLHFYWIQ